VLQELCVSAFVPNDTDISGGVGEDLPIIGVNELPDSKGMLLVTGANFSGKSVYLKQVNVQYLCQQRYLLSFRLH